MTSKEDLILQSGCVPYRTRKGKLELCLITSRNGRWGFPKGLIDPGETAEQTAVKEAEEEGGLVGEIEGRSIGSYRYRKWGSELLVTMFVMKVRAIQDTWEEVWRQREWVSPEAARQFIDRRELLPFVEAAEKHVLKKIRK